MLHSAAFRVEVFHLHELKFVDLVKWFSIIFWTNLTHWNKLHTGNLEF